MDDILELLEKLNFTKTEASVYVNLVKNSNLTGYQIAKNLNLSRSSVYSALDNLYKRGIIFLLPGDSQIYKAENPTTLINNMKKDFNDSAELLEKKLNQLQNNELEERFLNISGYDNVISKTKEMLLTAEKEVYINTDFDLQLFSEEFRVLGNRKVRIIVFSFSKLKGENLPIEIYSHEDEECEGKQTRMMLVVDYKKTLIADAGGQREEFLGTFTDNMLLTSIISEHIHHDIYLLKLRNKYSKDLIDDEIRINTISENK